MIVATIILLISGIILVILSTSENGIVLNVLGLFVLAIGVLVLSIFIEDTYRGYPSSFYNLPKNGVCEVLYKTPQDSDSNWIATIKLPDQEIRLVYFPDEPPLGWVKVQSDYSLAIFSTSPPPPTASDTTTEGVTTP